MDSMLGENKNLKDSERKSLKTSYGAGTSDMSFNLHYTKTNKLITALYMVTDTMEKEEPMRLKLRTLAIEILSDISTISKTPLDIEKVNQILSFLNIASDIRMISEMNCNILRKEFIELKQSIQEFTTQNHLWLEEFIGSPLASSVGLNPNSPIGHLESKNQTEKPFDKGQRLPRYQTSTRIGVQKGSTLLKALSKVGGMNTLNDFYFLKNKRRELILEIIKTHSSSGEGKLNGMSIKDIIIAIQSFGEHMGEKTLQRELISMIKDNVLKKTGEKRWSQYMLISNS